MVVVAMHQPINVAKRVEALARALGVWWSPDERRKMPIGLVVTAHDGQLLLQLAVTDASTWEAEAWTHVDAPTLAIILLGHARGLRVDLGECPACRERGSKRGLAMWEWRQRKPTLLDNLALGLDGGSQRVDMLTMKRACPACTSSGEPTGRHLLAWERAILDAMPKRAEVSCVAGEWGPIGQAMEAAKLGPFKSPGDPATRTALTVLAHRLADPEHVAVFGDWMIEQRDPAEFPAPRDGLAALLHAWLAGPCPTCAGTGRHDSPYVNGMGERVNHWSRCWPCRGHGTALGSLVPALSQALDEATAEARAPVASPG